MNHSNWMEHLAEKLKLDTICVATYNIDNSYELYYGYEAPSNYSKFIFFIELKFTKENWDNKYQNDLKIRTFILDWMKNKNILNQLEKRLHQDLSSIKNEELFQECLKILCQEK